jgi:hypothetical protein
LSDETDHRGHRERLRERFLTGGAGALPDYEMLELLLFGAIPRADTKPLAKRLLDRFGTYANVISAPPDDLKSVNGVGESVLATLKIVRDAGVRLARHELSQRDVISSWQQLIDYCRSSMGRENVEHHRGGAIPCDDVPSRRLHISRAKRQRIEHALEPRCDRWSRLILDFRRAAQAEQEKMLALDIGEHQCARDTIEDVSRRRAAAPLFEPRLPSGTYISPLRDLFAPQAGSAPTAQWKAELRRIEFSAPVAQIRAKLVAVHGLHILLDIIPV